MSSFALLPGSARLPLPNSRPAGHPDPSTPTSITVRVRSAGNLAELEHKAYLESCKPLAKRQYLSRDKLGLKYGALMSDLDKIERLAQDNGLFVYGRSAASRTIMLRGALGDILRTFPASLQMYHHASGPYRGRSGKIAVPEALKEIVTGVFGLDTRPKDRAPFRQRNFAATGNATGPALMPSTYAKRYNFPSVHNGVQLDGTGQTIGIIELGGGFRTNDINAYFQRSGLSTPSVVSVLVGDAINNQTASPSDSEVMLDIEVVGSIAPNARIAVYFAQANEDKGLLDALSHAIYDAERKPSVISVSWVMAEDYMDATTLDAYHELFAAAAGLGITICAATGDRGVGCVRTGLTTKTIHVGHPASDTMVLACGGTQVGSDGTDITWNDGKPYDPATGDGAGVASNGGISPYFGVPDYQQGLAMPAPLAANWPRPGNLTGRGIPDLAMSAVNYKIQVDGIEEQIGGTSAVAPLMSGLVALLNQAKQKNVGLLHPFLYANRNRIFTDVTVGDNGIKDSLIGYQAGPGWNACTGLGVPNGQNILDNL